MSRGFRWLAVWWLAGVVAQGQEAAPVLAPKLVCPEPRWEFGTVVNTQTIERIFAIRNEGNASLEIQSVRPTCGCTVANLSANTIPPGAEASLTVRLDLHGRSGTQMKQIRINSNDPNQAEYVLTLTGEATAEAQLRPPSLFFGRLNVASLVTGVVDVAFNTQNPISVLSAESEAPTLTTELETVETGRLYRVIIRSRGPLTVGNFMSRVNVRTDHPDAYAVLQIPVNFVVGGGLTVAPSEIVLAAGDTQPATRHVVLHSPDNQPFNILGVELPPADIRSTIFPMGQSGYRIQLDNLRGVPELRDAQMRIRTTSQDMPVVTIPFRLSEPTP